MIKKRIKILREKFHKYNIDGYIVPKNDEFFSEYSQKDRLKTISNFTGSAGFAIILKDQNYLFVEKFLKILVKGCTLAYLLHFLQILLRKYLQIFLYQLI